MSNWDVNWDCNYEKLNANATKTEHGIKAKQQQQQMHQQCFKTTTHKHNSPAERDPSKRRQGVRRWRHRLLILLSKIDAAEQVVVLR